MFSPGVLPNSWRVTPSATSIHGRPQSEAYNSRPPSRAPSFHSAVSRSAASDADWYTTGLSDAPQRIGPDRRTYLTRRQRQKQDELGNRSTSSYSVLAEHEQTTIENAEIIVKFKLLTIHAFPDNAQKKTWANEAYGQAYVSLGFGTSLFEN